LGNVKTVVSDAKIIEDIGTFTNAIDNNDNFVPEVLSYTDYYAFGAQMPWRSFNSGDYKYGFNGKENDDEIKGSGNSIDFGARILDPRLGRWLSLDPRAAKYPFYSPYIAFGNNPTYYIDPGGETLEVHGAKSSARRLLREINRSSDVKFKYEDGKLALKNPDAKATTRFSQQLVSSINDPQTVVLDLKRNKESFGVQIDDYATGRVDIDDLTSGDNKAFQQNMIHVLAERFGTENYESNKNVTSNDPMVESNWFIGHIKGLEAEEAFLKELYPDKNIKANPENDKTDFDNAKFDKNGKGTINSIFDFGDVQLIQTLEATKSKSGNISVTTTVVDQKIEVKN